MALAFPLNRLAQRLGRFQRGVHRWRLGKDRDAQIARWQALDEHGAKLEALMGRPEWVAVEERRQVAQRLRDLTLHASEATEAVRLKAATEWQAIDGFFRDLRLAIREGQQARHALAKVQEPRTN